MTLRSASVADAVGRARRRFLFWQLLVRRGENREAEDNQHLGCVRTFSMRRISCLIFEFFPDRHSFSWLPWAA